MFIDLIQGIGQRNLVGDRVKSGIITTECGDWQDVSAFLLRKKCADINPNILITGEKLKKYAYFFTAQVFVIISNS